MELQWLLVLAWACCPAAALCPAGARCTPKCCPLGQIKTDMGCGPGGHGYPISNDSLVVISHPDCPEMYFLDPEEDVYQYLYNGTLLVEENGSMVPKTDFCFDENPLNGTYVYLCFPPEDEEEIVESKKLEVYSIGIFISSPFIFVTFLVYATVKKLQTLHGKCIRFHTLCLFLSYFHLGLLQNGLLQEDMPCHIIGYAIQFFFLATFFWLNVMCFDIYWAFSSLKNLTGSVRERERKKLILYSIYAWCTPLLVLVITVAVDLSPSVPANSIFKPQVGVSKCFFKEKDATWIYFYLPMALIILSNIYLFGVTAFRIWSHRREAAVLKRVDSRKHDNTNDKERFTLYLKLFIVMGINWVMELLSTIVGGPGYLWYIPDFTNTLQGVFIFLIFVWKKRVRTLVWAKICECFGKKTISSRTSTPWSGGSTRNTSSSDSTRTTQSSIKMNPTTHESPVTLA